MQEARGLFDGPFDPPEAVEAAKQAGIKAAGDHADLAWKQAARAALALLAQTVEPFTADHVWAALEGQVDMPQTPAALGPLFLEAARHGRITKTGRQVRTRYARRHRDLIEWIGNKENV